MVETNIKISDQASHIHHTTKFRPRPLKDERKITIITSIEANAK